MKPRTEFKNTRIPWKKTDDELMYARLTDIRCGLGAYTDLMLIADLASQMLAVFPSINYALLSEEARAEVRALAARMGLRLDAPGEN